MEAYFQGKRELFEGLAIDKLESEWYTYPVLHLDLNAAKYTTPEALTSILGGHLTLWEKTYGMGKGEDTLSERFKEVIRCACDKTGHKVVILVDEYDKPLLQTYSNKELQDNYRATLPTKLHKNHQFLCFFAIQILFLQIFLIIKCRFTNIISIFADALPVAATMSSEEDRAKGWSNNILRSVIDALFLTI